MATYSQSITGADAGNLPYRPVTLTLPDTSASVGGQAAAMQNGTPLLCKLPDGSSQYFTLDPVSIPGVSRVLRRL